MKNYQDIDYGPLEELIGTWKGNQGTDIAPGLKGVDNNSYYETIVFEEAGSVLNANEQKLAVLHYRQIVRMESNDEIFHDQTGYWHWDADQNILMHSFVIPRAVNVIAGGAYSGKTDENGRRVLEVQAKLADPHWGIVQSPFMSKKASCVEFHQTIIVGDRKMSYSQTSLIDIYGKMFEHTDENELFRK
ncbi:conserved hypothetical protein [Candidatus Terasakiella magnetica]|uniref:THAP4-like heme-binding domain-containing protein n=1 Tax=Candidatus Terasakiella magnetica TaxID=1867952 RepID=A0A1C3RFR9_9PROT|nr:heme-binding beta-barrel domain-containing protein [Candidatus Terasakiella magnetica]SCA56054.1 conserved hypothetical protein [Candidatus Terasakiella magnetica]